MSSSLELLMPAGSVSKMHLALDYGADAVYLGPPLYSLRARDNHFHFEELKNSINHIHQLGKKGYITLNIFARNRKIKPFTEDILTIARAKPDAFIMSDPGLISIVRELVPEIPIHLSVQANCMNWQSVKFWQKSLGVERVILSRELSINEIKEIKQRVPDIELEAFVHGSICIAYSGRCLLSSYMDRRDANQGVCDNSCREKYHVHTAALNEHDFYIEDKNSNQGELYPIEEDEHGTYVLNAKDLCMIEHLQELVDAGVISFKVEGRTKSEFYAAMVARSYRGALDDIIHKRPYNTYWRQELDKLSHRGYHTGFMLGQPSAEGQNYEISQQYNNQFKFLGLVSNKLNNNIVEIKNKMKKGDLVHVLGPAGYDKKLKINAITSFDGLEKNEVHSGMGQFVFKFETGEQLPDRSILLTHPIQSTT